MTERVPDCNQRTNVQTCRCLRPLRLAFARQLPHRGSQGRLRRRMPADLPSAPPGRVQPAYNRPCRKASIMVPVRLSRFSVTGSMSSRRIQ